MSDKYVYCANCKTVFVMDADSHINECPACDVPNSTLEIPECVASELARRDEIIARLKEDAERLATRAVYWDDYGKEYECIYLECGGHSENILFDHAPDCPITLHRALMKELE